MVNVVTIWIFIDSMFEISIYPIALLALALFASVLFALRLSNIYLLLMFAFNKQPLYFAYVVLMEQMIITYYDYMQRYYLSFYGN